MNSSHFENMPAAPASKHRRFLAKIGRRPPCYTAQGGADGMEFEGGGLINHRFHPIGVSNYRG